MTAAGGAGLGIETATSARACTVRRRDDVVLGLGSTVVEHGQNWYGGAMQIAAMAGGRFGEAGQQRSTRWSELQRRRRLSELENGDLRARALGDADWAEARGQQRKRTGWVLMSSALMVEAA
ncbi:hypothetical protein M0R45_035770 [Rubus argutus]|uniref:Uncharacterized protein n=1 Tax=Rubus argutus TaxID=59490 RepID=A0AAW1VZE3_RUBAR